jgi:hypothetical protein
MPNWTELIDLRQFDALLTGVAIALPVVALVAGGLWGRRVGRVPAGLMRGVAVGLSGPLTYALWRLFAWLVRYDPVTGYCGLHRVSVLWLNVALFTVVGLVLGLVYGRVWQATAPADPAADSES